MRLNNIHVSSKEPVNPSLWVDTSGKKPILKGYVNGQYAILSEDVPDNVITKDMIVDSLESDVTDVPLSAAQGKALDSKISGSAPYIIDSSIFDKESPTSEEIDTAIGGWDNLVAAVQSRKVILLTTITNGQEVSSSYIVTYQQWTVRDSIENVVLVVSRTTPSSLVTIFVQITKENSNLQIFQGVNYSLSETEGYNDLTTTDKTVLGAINELKSDIDNINVPAYITEAINALDSSGQTASTGEVISSVSQEDGVISVSKKTLTSDDIPELPQSKITDLSTNLATKQNSTDDSLETTSKNIVGAINENTGNVTRIDRAVGNPTVEEHNFTVAESRKIWTSGGQKISSSNWFISEIINISKGDAISFKTNRTSGDIPAITKVSASGEFINAVVLMNADMDSVYWVADEDSHIQVTIPLSLKDNPYTIIKSSLNTAISDNSYMQYLHKVYEEYGAVYNAETGYWELNGLTDLTDEDMFEIWMASRGIEQLFDLREAFIRCEARTLFVRKQGAIGGVAGSADIYLNGLAYYAKNMEVFGLLKQTDSLYFKQYMKYAFYGCSKLKKILPILSITGTTLYATSAFNLCSSLSYVMLKNLSASISFGDSPLLSYDSLNYLVTNAVNTAAITVTVHPTTYSYLTGTAQPTEEVGGTTEEWQALVTTAQGKQISFAVPEETQSEVTE